jgi:hypothetical protein
MIGDDKQLLASLVVVVVVVVCVCVCVCCVYVFRAGLPSGSRQHCQTKNACSRVEPTRIARGHACGTASATFAHLIPKSSVGPPGLWLAVKMNPPRALRRRINADTAGVERIPFVPTMTFATCQKDRESVRERERSIRERVGVFRVE